MNNPINISKLVSLQTGGKTLLQNTELVISDKNKYGLIGLNGTGKTTLLNYIVEKYGSVYDTHIVSQEVPSMVDTVFNYVLNSNTIRNNLINKYAELTKQIEDPSLNTDSALKEIKKVADQMASLEVDKDESKIRKILHGLGFTIEEQNNSISSFSGGWRMRIALATALYKKPNLLLLDEPTNHLDLEACIWLTEYLSQYPNTLIIVSHDISFLDSVCTNIIYLDNNEKKLKHYTGNYSNYSKMKEIDDTNLEKEWKKLDRKVEELRKKSTKREVVDELIKKTGLPAKVKPYKINIEFYPNPAIDKNIVEFRDVSFGYTEDKMLFKNINFGIQGGSRITFVGKNGIGKSTLMKLLINQLQPISGEIIRDGRIRIEYFEQHCTGLLPLELSAIEYIHSIDTNLGEQDIRKLLGTIGLTGELHTTKLKNFSGGQKVRIAFVAVQVKKPHVIILDEPTNHLDIETIEALIKGINEFTGGLVMITHDVQLITETRSVLYEVTKEGIEETDYDKYKDRILEEIEI